MANNIEKRTYRAELVSSDAGGVTVTGHAAVFNTETRLWDGTYETIAPGAFRNAIGTSDVKFLLNHDPSQLLGRTKSGTLTIHEDAKGLLFEANLPKTRADIIELMDRGDLDECSFAFTIKDFSEQKRADGSILVTINEVSKLYDVSIVTYPAYPGTDASLASADISPSYRSAISRDQPMPPSDGNTCKNCDCCTCTCDNCTAPVATKSEPTTEIKKDRHRIARMWSHQ